MRTSQINRALGAVVALILWANVAGTCLAAADPSTDLQSHFARSGTNRIHYVTVGTGDPAVVFIHGWGGNTRFWKEQLPPLQKKARLVLIDLAGHGQSDKPAVDYTMDYYAHGVLDILRDAKIDRATLVGHSMGVVVLCRIYALAPQKVAALVAIDGLLRRPKFDPAQAEAFIAPYRKPDYRTQVTNFIGAMFPNPGTDSLRSWTLSEVLATPQHVLSSSMDAMFRADQPTWNLEKVKAPLVVINAKSAMWTPEYEAYARSLSDRVEYRTLEGPGHFLMLERPAEFNAILVESLEKYHLVR